MRYFTLGDLGLRGNYTVMINYENADGSFSEFIDFLCSLDLPHNNIQKPEVVKSQNELKPPHFTDVTSNNSCKISTLSSQSGQDISEIEFTVSKPSNVSATSRKY